MQSQRRGWYSAPVAAHLSAGLLLALVLAIADVAIGRVAPWIDRASVLDVARAVLTLAAMLMPVGVLSGLTVSLLGTALRPLPWFARAHTVLAHPARWFDRDPPAFAWLASVVLVVPLLQLTLWRTALHFATGYHNPELSALAMSATALLVFAVTLVLTSVLRLPLLALGARIGRVGSVGSVMAFALLSIGGLVLWVWRSRRDLFAVIDLRSLCLCVGALAAYPLLWALMDRALRTQRRRRVSTALVVFVSSVALMTVAHLYSRSHRVRAIVERETSFGISLLHGYAALADTDHDGYAFLFGGGDCHDGDRNIHPGAIEVAADGVDSNCMGGDTDPDVADLSDGRYGTVPVELGRPNLLLITIDALRPDRLGAYNPAQRKVSPRIDAFAKDAVRFDQALSPSSRSIRSIPSMMIGAYPSQIAFGPEHLWPALLPDNITATEALAQHGYQTAAVIGTNYFSHLPDFFQGFAHVLESRAYKPPRKEAAGRAIELLDKLQRRKAPWMMWVHLFNVHEPYLHDHIPSRFGTQRMGSYDTEVSLADEQVGRLLDWLKEHGDPAHTVVAIASDHGEAFLEHGTIGHSYTLYNEELRSTLLVRVPGETARSVSTPVSLIDLAPTLLNLASVPLPRPLPARSLLPLIQGKAAAPHRALYAELMPDGYLPYDEKAVVLDDWKLIWWEREGSIQLFDLKNDPGERRDLSDVRRDRGRQLHDRLRAWVTQTHLRQHRRDEILVRHRLRAVPDEIVVVDADYGPFTLVGYRLAKRDARPGDKIALDLFFQVRGGTRDDYFFEITFDGPSGYAVPRYLNAAHYPLNGAYRTYEWRAGELLRDPIQITVPNGTLPATLRMRMRVIRRGADRVVLQAPAAKNGWLPLGDVEIRK